MNFQMPSAVGNKNTISIILVYWLHLTLLLHWFNSGSIFNISICYVSDYMKMVEEFHSNKGCFSLKDKYCYIG